MSKEGKAGGDRVRETCVLNGLITELWSVIRPFTFQTMPSVFQSVQALSGPLGEPNSVCLITYANGDSERVRITSVHDGEHSVKYDVLNAEERVVCQRSLLLLPVSDKRQVYVEFTSQYPNVIPLKDFIDEQLKKRTFFKALRIALGSIDEAAPWDCPFCTTQNPPTQHPFCVMCKRRNYSRGIKWTTLKFDWMLIKDTHRVESGEFELAGFKWKVLLFPYGSSEHERGHVGVFLNALELPDGAEIPCDFFARIVHPSELHGVKGCEGDKSVIVSADWIFTKHQFDRGWGALTRTQSVESLYLTPDGQFTVQVGIGLKKRAQG